MKATIKVIENGTEVFYTIPMSDVIKFISDKIDAGIKSDNIQLLYID